MISEASYFPADMSVFPVDPDDMEKSAVFGLFREDLKNESGAFLLTYLPTGYHNGQPQLIVVPASDCQPDRYLTESGLCVFADREQVDIGRKPSLLYSERRFSYTLFYLAGLPASSSAASSPFCIVRRNVPFSPRRIASARSGSANLETAVRTARAFPCFKSARVRIHCSASSFHVIVQPASEQRFASASICCPAIFR